MKNKKLATIVAVGLMAALCFVGNYLQIKIPNGVLITRIHFGNAVCLLAGLLFGGIPGGLAAGIGSGLYDLLDPVYIISAPFTFLSKFAMGFLCGYLAKSSKRQKNETAHIALSAIFGQLAYIVLYVGRTYVVQRLVYMAAVETALTATATNLLTSSINAIIAIAVSVPLYFALQKPLKATYFRELLGNRTESENAWYYKPCIVIAFIGLCAIAVLFYVLKKA